MESLVHYSNPSHALSVLGALNEQRLRGQMCDVTLVVADQKYQAHKSVLAASSEYFQSLFTRMDSESLKVVNLDFCEPDAFEIVLNYIYSSSLFVDKGSLAAIQELGYSLGIPFLTNIVSARPHASYCVSRKRLSFSEGDENDVQTRSVIVRRVRNDTTLPSRSSHLRKTSERSASPHSVRESTQPPSGQNSYESMVNSESITTKSSEQNVVSERKSTYPYTSILKGNSSHMASVRPQLTTSVSFSDAEVQHIRVQPDAEQDVKEENEEREPRYQTKAPYQGQTREQSQTIDRSGPLIKSLLRRSLSMDSPVPVFSPTLELKELQNREQSVVKMASKASGPETPVHNGSSKRTSPLVLRSRFPSRYEKETQAEREVSVKAEPSSPLADPMEIIRITVGDTLPVSLKDLQANYEQGARPDFSPLGKRKDRPDNRRYPFKKSKIFKEHSLRPDENESESVPQSARTEPNENSEEPPQNKIFKCWNCLKVFRSSAGLHRHVNMYHNPEKPYACDICHKRFHTNFKVWTHCQTQHGVVQNPASSSSSVLDEKFQKKLIDIVREREIKKALLWKLKRNKQGLQSSTLTKKRSRPNFICPYCGKVFVFQSQYRQHLRTHPTEKNDQDTARENIYQEQDEVVEEKSSDTGVYSCRLCNMKLSSLFEQGDHERGCRHATVCPYCGLRFSSPAVKKDHEAHCKYKKLTCLECMRTFKSSFSIWRHQVEVHNHNMMTVKDQLHLKQLENNEEVSEMLREEHYSDEPLATGSTRENISYSDSSGPAMYDSEDSSSYVPEDLSMGHQGKLVVKEEPVEEAVSERDNTDAAKAGSEEAGVWPCEKCGNLFSSRKDLERHQELLCHIKPFICHICNKAFRTNFRLWSHFQSHMSTAGEPGAKEIDRHPSPLSPSPPMTPQNSERPPPPQASVLKSTQPVPVAAAIIAEESSSPEPCGSSVTKARRAEAEQQQQQQQQPSSRSPLSRSNSMENPSGPQEPDTLFYHAPSLSALTFKRQYMCKLCHRTFKTAFSLWSHEQSHSHM
ncbi:zinc finger and BTB domain-containing protein 21 [Sphaeramia orbicularis]|uniref:Zinc finger and BTB domain containing 21 n=1 Tax=Sphaeramia orbicularis TaxID=375764 RepID=A0A672YYM5_9TELE|nr:zinc finger and BTB domain-containing protein 21 [Sphaeramia orbicularis]